MSFAATAVRANQKRDYPSFDLDRESSKELVFSLESFYLFPIKLTLFPLHLVTEYGLRKPLRTIGTIVERDHWYEHYVDFLTTDEKKEFGFFPYFNFEFGFRPNIGLHIYKERFPNKYHRPELWLSYGGEDWFSVKAQDQISFPSKKESLIANVAYIKRPDFTYFGEGPETLESSQTRYAVEELSAELKYENIFWRESLYEISFSASNNQISNGNCCSDLSIEEGINRGLFNSPESLNSDYTILRPGFRLELGNRVSRPEEDTGGRIVFNGALNKRLDRENSDWAQYGLSVAGFTHLGDYHKTLTLTVTADTVKKLGSREIPFHELIGNNGTDSLLGFRQFRILGDSIFSAELEYKWPVWAYLDGFLHYSLGNAFGENLQGLNANIFRQSMAMGLRKTSKFGPFFNILVGAGSEPFSRGGNFNSARLVIGGGRGF